MENPIPLPSEVDSSYHSVDLSDTIEVVATWKDSKATSVKIHTVSFDIQNIQSTLTEISRAIRNIHKNDSDSLSLLSKTRELLTTYETHFSQIEEHVDKQITIHHGGLYTFCKLVMISWLLLKESLTIWRESQNQLISHNQFTFAQMRHSIAQVFSSSLTPTSSLYRTLLPPLLIRPSPTPPSEPTERTERPSVSLPTLNWIHRQVIERQHDLEQLLPIMPLMVTLLKEKKRTKSDHLKLIGVDETDKIPIVLPFWYKYNKNLHGFSKLLHTTFVTVGESHKISDGIKKYAVATVTAIKCTFDPVSASHKAREITHGSVNIDLLTSIWNLPDKPWVQTFTNLQLPRVAVSQVIEIPAPNEGYLKGPIQARIISSKPLPFSIEHLLVNQSPGYVSNLTRVLSFSKLLSSFFVDEYSTPSLPLVLHFHGGGFVSGSSAMHEGYLREWANQTGITILSVDYRLAPQYKFPTAVEECYHVYKWLMTTCKLGMKVKKIALVGDSAGGNLVSGVVIKALEEGIPVPDGVIMQYPALDMCTTINASRLLYKNDILVPLSVMKLCRKAYLPDKPLTESVAASESEEAGADYDSFEVDPELAMNPLVSPIHVSDTVLAKFPPVYLAAGDFDPLLDECITYGKRLKFLGKLQEFKIYEGMIHGFLSIADKQVPEAAVAIRDSGNWLKRILL